MSEKVITNWYIRYNDDTKMPDFVSGVIVDGENSISGKLIDNIIYMDQYENSITTNSGEIYKLAGPGTRILYVNEDIAREYEQKVMHKWVEENDLSYPQD